MKKKFVGIIAIFAIAAVAGYNVYVSKNDIKLTDLAFANIDALANPGEGFDCQNGCVDNGNGCFCYQWYPYFHEH